MIAVLAFTRGMVAGDGTRPMHGSAGQNYITVRGKFNKATKGTSIASIVARKYLPYEIKCRILPAFTGIPLINCKYILTKKLEFLLGDLYLM